ncbi:unnamed protein product [Cylicocyclus nassatus]|uniref:Uncharacterized protein n=1 Tax=Cylicocyclus nassatus TaxID=53992 RepID=A0AA36HCV8_CYLNA|nr:unnamed protein product [Cylicocyclus nassatus]
MAASFIAAEAYGHGDVSKAARIRIDPAASYFVNGLRSTDPPRLAPRPIVSIAQVATVAPLNRTLPVLKRRSFKQQSEHYFLSKNRDSMILLWQSARCAKLPCRQPRSCHCTSCIRMECACMFQSCSPFAKAKHDGQHSSYESMNGIEGTCCPLCGTLIQWNIQMLDQHTR